MHVDSQKNTPRAGGESENTADSFVKRFDMFGQSSSRDPNPQSVDTPFTDRIRAGMVVRWKAPENLQYGPPGSLNMAVILCPATAFASNPGHIVTEIEGEEKVVSSDPDVYLCALVSPGVMRDSYTLDLWRQVVISKLQMESEVILEYDSATRYYHIAI